MKTFSDRLNAAMRMANISQGQLAEAVGISQPAVQKMTSGKTAASGRVVQIAAFLGVRPEWLASGIGEMRQDGVVDEINKITISKNRSCYRVDVLDVQASAGPGVFVSSDFVEKIRAIEYTPDQARALFGGRKQDSVKMITVTGDSMEGTINPGDEIFVDVSVRRFDGDGVYVFAYGKTLHVKRLQMQKDRMAVISDNSRYEKWYLSETEEPELYVIAKVLLRQSIDYKRLG